MVRARVDVSLVPELALDLDPDLVAVPIHPPRPARHLGIVTGPEVATLTAALEKELPGTP
ncbi:hypothetical protein [Amycolatopsis sp. NPDC054798]